MLNFSVFFIKSFVENTKLNRKTHLICFAFENSKSKNFKTKFSKYYYIQTSFHILKFLKIKKLFSRIGSDMLLFFVDLFLQPYVFANSAWHQFKSIRFGYWILRLHPIKHTT